MFEIKGPINITMEIKTNNKLEHHLELNYTLKRGTIRRRTILRDSLAGSYSLHTILYPSLMFTLFLAILQIRYGNFFSLSTDLKLRYSNSTNLKLRCSK